MNRKRVSRLMKVMGLEAVYPKPKLSQPGRRAQDLSVFAQRRESGTRQPGVEHGHHLHPDAARVLLLGGSDGLAQPVRAQLGHCPLTMEVEFCVKASIKNAMRRASVPRSSTAIRARSLPAKKFTERVEDSRAIGISMDGRGRCFDNIFIERLWRSLKYEEVYLKDYATVAEARAGIARWFQFYNHERLSSKPELSNAGSRSTKKATAKTRSSRSKNNQ